MTTSIRWSSASSLYLLLSFLLHFRFSVAPPPTPQPTPTPTALPTFSPTPRPTAPSAEPTPVPSRPTKTPSMTSPPSLQITPMPTVVPTLQTAAPTALPTMAPSTPTFAPSASPSFFPTNLGKLIPKPGRYYYTTFHRVCNSQANAYSVKTVPLGVCRVTSPFVSAELPGTSEMYTCAQGVAKFSIDNRQYSGLTCAVRTPSSPVQVVYHDSVCRKVNGMVEGTTGGYTAAHCGDVPFTTNEQILTKSYRSPLCAGATASSYKNAASMDKEFVETRGTFVNTCIAFSAQNTVKYHFMLTYAAGDGVTTPLQIVMNVFLPTDEKCSQNIQSSRFIAYPVPLPGGCVKDPLYPGKYYSNVLYNPRGINLAIPTWY